MQDDRTATLKRSRFFQTLALSCLVVAVMLHVLEISAAWGRLMTLLYAAGASAFFLLLYLLFAPLCRECKFRPWSIFSRTHVCCFMEKTALKNSFIRSSRFVGWFLLGAGVLSLLQPRLAAGHRRFGDLVVQRLSSPETLRNRALLDTARRKWEEDRQDPDAIRNYAYLLMRSERYADADRLVVEGLESSPEDLDLLMLHAVLARPLKDQEGEIATWEKILKLREDDAEARHNLGMALLRTGEAARAEVELRRAVDQAVDDLVRFKQLHRIDRENRDDLPEALAAQFEGLKYRAGASAYQLALAAALQDKPEREQHLKLARNLGYETSAFDRDVAALQGS